jgi:hypothetical protein
VSEARLHALHWAFFVDVMDMEFADVYTMFSAWCESVPADEMTGIMALGDELFSDIIDDDDNTDNESEPLYTEEEIWNDTSNANFSLN